MAGIHKILAPVDFSTCSRAALEHAVELTERYFGATIDVLHVWEPPQYVGPHTSVMTPVGKYESIEQIAQVAAMKEMEGLLADAEKRGIVPFRRIHEVGDPIETILAVAKREPYDLIVLGTHGRTGMSHDYLGSIAEKVVRRAPCPVLTFRAKTKP